MPSTSRGYSLNETTRCPDDHEHRVIGSRLREARRGLGFTQGDIAIVLQIPRTSVVALEQGTRKITGLELRRLARLYRRDIAWFFGEALADEPDVALQQATADLSPGDRDQVLSFARFLASQPSSG